MIRSLLQKLVLKMKSGHYKRKVEKQVIRKDFVKYTFCKSVQYTFGENVFLYNCIIGHWKMQDKIS